MASSYLKRTPSSPGSNTTGTVSAWVKLDYKVDYNCIIGGNEGSSSSDRSLFSISSDGTIYNQIVDGSTAYTQESNRDLRDPTAWYHIVYQFDTSNGTQADRIKTYVNNELIDSWSTTAAWPSSVDIKLWDSAASAEYMIGCRKSSSSYQYFFNGNMAHVHVVDGTIYAPTVFGEVDSTSGIWVPITSPSVTYGTNGGFYKFASGALGTDSAGSNNMTAVGSMTTALDSPDNNFCKMNPLDNRYLDGTFSNCDTTVTTNNATWTTATMQMGSGLWYWEVQPTGTLGGGECLGFIDRPTWATSYAPYSYGKGAVVRSGGDLYIDTSNTTDLTPGGGDLWVTSDVIGVYMDLTANKVYFAKNGTILNSGTGVAITAAISTFTNGGYMPIWGSSNTTNTAANFNFGEGNLGTTALTGTTYADSNGEGKFKYSPNDGGAASFDSSAKNFLAICTNNIATGS